MASKYLLRPFQQQSSPLLQIWSIQPLRPIAFSTRTHPPNSLQTTIALRLRRSIHQIPPPPPPPQDPAATGSESSSTPAAESSSPLLGGKKPLLPPRREPVYELTFTCVPCGGRSTHNITKQGYHKGSVLIACPECRNRHVISDHLNIFGSRKITVEDLLRESGQLVKKGTLGEDGDLEFWADGTITSRTERNELPPSQQLKDKTKKNEDPVVPGSTFKSSSTTTTATNSDKE